jgi:hypothetical protein
MFGTSFRHEIGLSGDVLVMGAYSDIPGAVRGNDASSAGAAAGVDSRASWAVHLSATLREAIKKMTDQNLIEFTLQKF